MATLECLVCEESLLYKKEKDNSPSCLKNCFGHALGPRDNPFLPKISLLPTEPNGLQPVAIKCGHCFHRGCLKKQLRRGNGMYVHTGSCPICGKCFTLNSIIAIHLNAIPAKEDTKVNQEIKKLDKEIMDMRKDMPILNAKQEKEFNLFIYIQNKAFSISKQLLDKAKELKKLDSALVICADDYNKKVSHLEALEEENVFLKFLTGSPVRIDSDGYAVFTPTPPPSVKNDTTSETEESESDLDKPEIDYTVAWSRVPSPTTKTKVSRRVARDPDLLSNGLYSELPIMTELDHQFDLANILTKLKLRIDREDERNEKAQALKDRTNPNSKGVLSHAVNVSSDEDQNEIEVSDDEDVATEDYDTDSKEPKSDPPEDPADKVLRKMKEWWGSVLKVEHRNNRLA